MAKENSSNFPWIKIIIFNNFPRRNTIVYLINQDKNSWASLGIIMILSYRSKFSVLFIATLGCFVYILPGSSCVYPPKPPATARIVNLWWRYPTYDPRFLRETIVPAQQFAVPEPAMKSTFFFRLRVGQLWGTLQAPVNEEHVAKNIIPSICGLHLCAIKPRLRAGLTVNAIDTSLTRGQP